MRRWLLMACGLALSCASSTSGTGSGGAPSGGPVAETELGLAKGNVTDTPEPPRVTYRTSDPGEEPSVPRPFAFAPPSIPHGLEQVTPITRTDHPCRDCHALAEQLPGDPKPLSDSHYTDYRADPPKRGTELSSARYDCLTCHIRQSDAELLVESRF